MHRVKFLTNTGTESQAQMCLPTPSVSGKATGRVLSSPILPPEASTTKHRVCLVISCPSSRLLLDPLPPPAVGTGCQRANESC